MKQSAESRWRSTIELPHYSSSIEHPSLMTYSTPHQAAAMHPTAQPVSTTQYVAPPWQGKFALFTSKPGSKTPYSGRISIAAADIPQVVAYLQQAIPSQRGDVELWLSGFVNTAKNTGQQYIGGYVSPQTQGLAVRYGQQQVALQQAHAGQQQAMVNAQQHAYGQSQAPQPQPQPAPLPAQPGPQDQQQLLSNNPPF